MSQHQSGDIDPGHNPKQETPARPDVEENHNPRPDPGPRDGTQGQPEPSKPLSEENKDHRG